MARDLLGATIVVADGTRAEIVEVEAYLGEADAASHAWRGPTPRTRIMFGPAGHLYVYLSYGMHCCANVVTETDGVAGAVLLRAARVLEGTEAVRARRRATTPDHRLLSGPGNLCAGLGITLGDNGLDLSAAGARVRIRPAHITHEAASGPRVGITRNPAAPLRFWIPGERAVSR